MNYIKRFTFWTLFLFFLFTLVFTSPAFSSVVLVGTRIIYAGAATDKTLQFTNQDAFPNLVQIWVDKENPQSRPETADAPFVATPQIFRINPNAGQLVRLVYTGAYLPSDRESVFYLNFMQIPALKPSQQASNMLQLAVTSRVKVLYRPVALKGSPDSMASDLKFKLQGSGESANLLVENVTGFHAVIREVSLISGGQTNPLVANLMLAPKSTTSWTVPSSAQSAHSPRRLRLTLVNDLGANVVSEFALE